MPDQSSHESTVSADTGSAPVTVPIGPTAPSWTSEELLRGSAEALIVHGGEVYRLRRTRNQKLILIK
ncbi:MAG: hemin uptake protein HemP [Pirellulales bacterium]